LRDALAKGGQVVLVRIFRLVFIAFFLELINIKAQLAGCCFGFSDLLLDVSAVIIIIMII